MPYGSNAYGGSPYGGAPAGSPSATLAAVVALTATGSQKVHGTATLTATVALTANGFDEATATLHATVALASTGTVTAAGGHASLSAHLGLTAHGTQTQHGTAILSASLASTATGSVAGAPGSAILSASLAFTATGTVPPAVFSPIGLNHTVRYWLTTLDPSFGPLPIDYPIAELPFTNVTFTKTFNQAGPFSATLNLEDEQVVNTDWIKGTNPGKTFFWILIDNSVVFGGRILGRNINARAQTATITGTDFYSYWTQRLQAADYGAYIQNYTSASYTRSYAWAQPSPSISASGAPAPMIAWKVLRDAADVIGSLPNLSVPFHGEGPGTKSDPDTWIANYDPANFVTFSAPESQQQSVDAMVQQFSGMGDRIGCDVVHRVYLDANGNPYATTNVSWPRHGKTADELGKRIKVLDLSTVLDMDWNEDATAQATGLVEQTGAGGIMALVEFIDETAITAHHYPLLQQAVTHTGASPTALSKKVLRTLLKGDQDLYTYPQLAPTVTLPVFAHTGLALLDLLPLGDDISVFNPFERQTITGLPSLPFPPKGFLATMRVVRADVTIADEGVSTMVLTLNPAPGDPSPPGYS